MHKTDDTFIKSSFALDTSMHMQMLTLPQSLLSLGSFAKLAIRKTQLDK